MSSSKDPLNLAELDPEHLQRQIEAKGSKKKETSELELQKEARLAEKEKRLNTKLPTKSEAPTSAPPPPPIKDRSTLLDKISAYRERFPNLKKRNTISAKSSIEEIIDELHYCELQLGSQGGQQNIGATVLVVTMTGLEKITREYWNPLGLDLNGLATVSAQNMNEFQPILDELMIKHNAGVYTSPEWRLALAIGATVLTVNAANRDPDTAKAVKRMNQAVNRPAGSDDL
jgi:hypothetical protein